MAMSESDLKNLVDSIEPIAEERSGAAKELEIEEVGQDEKTETPSTGEPAQVGGATLRNGS